MSEIEKLTDRLAFLAMLRNEWENGCDTSGFTSISETYYKDYDSIPFEARNQLMGYAHIEGLWDRQQRLIDADQIVREHIAKDERRQQLRHYYTGSKSKEEIEHGARLFTVEEREEAYMLESMHIQGSYRSDPASLYSSVEYVGPSRSSFNHLRKKYCLPPLPSAPQTTRGIIIAVIQIAVVLLIAGAIAYGVFHPAPKIPPTPCYSAEQCGDDPPCNDYLLC